jgi:predicted nucleic acid-binding protein
MTLPQRLLLDTIFIQSLLSKADQNRVRAIGWAKHLRNVREVWVTEAVLVDVGNALSALNRAAAVRSIDEAYRTRNVRVVTVDTALLRRAIDLYRARPDKEWGLTDCISFVVMTENGIMDALTADHHFVQAGFNALLLQDPPPLT